MNDRLLKLKVKIKSSLLVRTLVSPYMMVKKRQSYNEYQKSNEKDKIKELKDKYAGKRCFIVGSGPSLRAKDLDRIKDEVTFAANSIFSIYDKTEWRPTFYMVMDPDADVLIKEGVEASPKSITIIPYHAKDKISISNENVLYAQFDDGKYVINRYNDKKSHISKDVSRYFSSGYTVTFAAIQLAIYMGIKEIYLLGVDFNYSYVANKWGRIKKLEGVESHFYKKNEFSFLNYYSVLRAYKKTREYCDTNNIVIKNATRGGKLEVFERVDFDTLV